MTKYVVGTANQVINLGTMLRHANREFGKISDAIDDIDDNAVRTLFLRPGQTPSEVNSIRVRPGTLLVDLSIPRLYVKGDSDAAAFVTLT